MIAVTLEGVISLRFMRWSSLFIALVTLPLRVVAAQSAIRHPTPENLRLETTVPSVSQKDTVSGLDRLDRVARDLRRAARVDSIGRLDGSPDDAIGMIMDIDVDSSSRVFILDRAFQMVRVFDADGSPSFTVGRSGSGPLEFRSVVALWLEGSSLFTVDAVLGLKRIEFDKQGVPRLGSVVRLDGGVNAACGRGEQVVTLAPSVDAKAKTRPDGSEPYIRIHDTEGRTRHTFGSSYRSQVWLVRQVMSEGVVECASGGRIVEALSRLPFVRAYDRAGALKWSAKLSDYVVGTSLERGDSRGGRRIGVDPNDPRGSFTLRIRELTSGLVVVQVGLVTRESLLDRSLWSVIDTYLFDVETGRGVYVGSDLPLLGRLRGSRVYGFENDPFPRVVILRIQGAQQS